MIKRRQLVIVGKTSLRVPAVQFFRQFQHIISITGLRTIDVVDEVHAGLLAGEVLATTVATKGQRTLTRHDVPEIDTGIVIGLIAREFSDTFESYHLRHLGVGMHIVETVLSLRQWDQQPVM